MTNQRLWLLLATCAGLALFGALYPLYVIRPFRAQGPHELQAALLVMRLRPAATLLCFGTAALAIFCFRHLLTRRSARIAAAAALLLTLLASAAVRINVFELMFHPINQPAFERASAAKLAADEMVLAVGQRGAARAYPVRAIAYHHIVNDSIGEDSGEGMPIVATY